VICYTLPEPQLGSLEPDFVLPSTEILVRGQVPTWPAYMRPKYARGIALLPMRAVIASPIVHRKTRRVGAEIAAALFLADGISDYLRTQEQSRDQAPRAKVVFIKPVFLLNRAGVIRDLELKT
jgi:hypothetical protein